MVTHQSAKLLLPIVLFCVSANAATVFNFDGDSPGTSTTFTDTVNGLSATFSSSADPGGFVVYASMFETLTGNVLGDPGPAFTDNLALNINFSQNLSAIALNFATSDFVAPSPLTLSLYENSALVSSTSSAGQVLPGFFFPEGEIAYSGSNFNHVVITSTATDFAIDNISALPAATAAPEPGSLTLIGTGLLLSAISRVRRRKTPHR